MRFALAAGALALTIAFSGAVARADTSSGISSPDVATWTSHLTVSRDRAGNTIEAFTGGIAGRTSRLAQQLTRTALQFLGTPYVFGGESPGGFDCSGYVQYLFARLGVAIPRTADAQFYAGKPISGPLSPGDLVFFQTYAPGPSHVGIYLGNGKFVHSAGRAVKVSSLSDSYYAPRYLGARRFIAVTQY